MIFLQKINKIKAFVLDLIFPKTCLGCHQEGFYLCCKCLEKIPLTDKLTCPYCQKITLYGQTCENCQRKRKNHLNGLVFATAYRDHIINQAIKIFKYKHIRELAHPLGQLIIKLIKNSGFLVNNFSDDLSCFLIIPIPLDRKKFLWRGFNQSEILAQQIAEEFGLNLKTNLLIKTKSTPSQTELKKEARETNLQDVFAVKNKDEIYPVRTKILNKIISFCKTSLTNKKNNLLKNVNSSEVKNKIIFLIDDVFTTGSTLNEAAKELKNSGAKEVWGITLAKD